MKKKSKIAALLISVLSFISMNGYSNPVQIKPVGTIFPVGVNRVVAKIIYSNNTITFTEAYFTVN